MKKVLPHICLDLSLIFLTLWVIDRINPMMHMLSRDVFKIPLMIFLLLVILQSLMQIARQRADQRKAERRHRKAMQAKERTKEI